MLSRVVMDGMRGRQGRYAGKAGTVCGEGRDDVVAVQCRGCHGRVLHSHAGSSRGRATGVWMHLNLAPGDSDENDCKHAGLLRHLCVWKRRGEEELRSERRERREGV